jgi:hypothetical protein
MILGERRAGQNDDVPVVLYDPIVDAGVFIEMICGAVEVTGSTSTRH